MTLSDKHLKVFSRLAVAIIIAYLALVLCSWFLSATMTPGVRSLLSGEGIRWFFARFTDAICSPVLAWLLMLAIAVGCLKESGLLHPSKEKYRRRKGLHFSLVLLLAYVAVLVLLTALPQAVLLSATGKLSNSPFSQALVPIICFVVVLCSVGYGVVVRKFTSFAYVFQTMSSGISSVAPWLVLYMLAVQLVDSICYVFCSL